MPGPAIETLITRNVVATLGNVAPSTGFPVQLIIVDPGQRKPSPSNGTTYITVGDRVPVADENTPAGWKQWMLTIGVSCVIIQDETSTIPTRELVTECAAAVEQAMIADFTRGQNALRTEQVGCFPDYPREGEVWVHLAYEIEYRTLRLDPFNPQ